MLRETSENKMTDTLCSCAGRVNIVKVSALFKLIYRFNKISIKITAGCLVEIDKLMLKFIWK